MQPLSRRTRRAYFYTLILLFIVLLPLVILYASGYRFKNGFQLVQTGGIFISVPSIGATVSLNGSVIGESSLFNRNFFIDDLAPGSYALHVTRQDTYSWYRTLIVEPKLVTDAAVLLVPRELNIVRIVPQYLDVAATSSVRFVTRAEYTEYIAAFREENATTTSGAMAEQNGAGVFVKNGDTTVRFLSATSTVTSNFCVRPSYCVFEIPIENGLQTSTHADFWERGVVYATTEGGVSIFEADIRQSPVSAPLYPKPGAEFRVIDGELIVKDGAEVYEIVGL